MKTYTGPYKEIADQVRQKRRANLERDELLAIARTAKDLSERLFAVEQHGLGAHMLDIVERIRRRTLLEG